MSPIKDFELTYEALNDQGVFSEGDPLAGTVRFTLTKETKVKSFHVKVKGAGSVHWSEGSGDHRKSYSAYRTYFKIKEDLLAQNVKGNVLHEGAHQYKFRFQIPQGEMPSSFKGYHGKIYYTLEAKISRSWKFPSKVERELSFVSRSLSHQGLVVCPSSGSVDKELGVFNKGQVQMSATVDKNVCSPGDTLNAVATITNYSSKKVKPKFSLQKKIVYRAEGHRNVSDESLVKGVGNNITSNLPENVSCQLKVPEDVIYSLRNCDIISVEYYVKVYLDISFTIDPTVVFPLVIVPRHFAPLHPGQPGGLYPPGAAGAPSYSDFPSPAMPMGPYLAGAVGGPSNSDFPPPAFPVGPYPVPPGPGPYGYPGPAPTPQVNYNQWPQQAPPYSFPAAPFPPPAVQNQDPTAQPPFQQDGQLPSYTSLYPASQKPYGETGSDTKS